MNSKVACITGANRGIGFEIAKKLAVDGFIIVMACRDVDDAKRAEAEIRKSVDGAFIEHVYLDLGIPTTAKSAAAQIGERFHHGMSVLVNNAGFAYHWDAPEPFHRQAIDSIGINYHGTVAVCEAMVPLIRPGGRLINVSSSAGMLSSILSDGLRFRWRSCDSKESVESLLQEFMELTKKDQHLDYGWPSSAYGVSKLALTTYTRILAQTNQSIHVFSCCPGACQTRMSTFSGNKTAEEGADTPVWLAVSDDALHLIPQGSFVVDRKNVDELP